MVQIVYRQERQVLTVTGHAGAGQAGHDLVCAAVTALVATLAENLRQMEAAGALRSLSVELAPGDARIEWCPVSRMRSVVELTCDSILVGLRQIAQAHPGHVSFEQML